MYKTHNSGSIKDDMFENIMYLRNRLIGECRNYEELFGIPIATVLGLSLPEIKPEPVQEAPFTTPDKDGIVGIHQLNELRAEIEKSDKTGRVAPNIFGDNKYAVYPVVEYLREQAKANPKDTALQAELNQRALFLECEIDNFSFGFDIDPGNADLFELWEQTDVNGYPRMRKTGETRPEVRIAPKKCKTIDDVVEWFRERAERQLAQEALVQFGPPPLLFGAKTKK